MGWQPGNDFCIRFEDKTRTPRTVDELTQLVRRVSRIARYYGFDLSCFGSWNDMKELSRLEDEKHRAMCPQPASPPVSGSRDYVVHWCVETVAMSPREAAQQALAMHRDPESIATVFDVTDTMTNEKTTIDLNLKE